MRAEFDDWKANDDLLEASLDTKNDFFWHSHTLSHQARDNLGEVDCESEDGGKNSMTNMLPPGQRSRQNRQPPKH